MFDAAGTITRPPFRPSKPSTKCCVMARVAAASAADRWARPDSVRGLLVVHGLFHEVPLFLASFAAFLAALTGDAPAAEDARAGAPRGAARYAEYYFLFPLFVSVTLLTSAGFFEGMHVLMERGIADDGPRARRDRPVPGATFLSAILDNNVVADFASRGLHGFDPTVIRLFAMAQIAGYALGGCWTHIGCAQSVVAYAFIHRDLDGSYTPLQWIKEMTPVIFQILVAMSAIIYAEAFVHRLVSMTSVI